MEYKGSKKTYKALIFMNCKLHDRGFRELGIQGFRDIGIKGLRDLGVEGFEGILLDFKGFKDI